MNKCAKKIYGVITMDSTLHGRVIDISHSVRALRRRFPTRPIHRLTNSRLGFLNPFVAQNIFDAGEIVNPGEFAFDAERAARHVGKIVAANA